MLFHGIPWFSPRKCWISHGLSTTDSELIRQETASQGANASVCLENFPPGQVKEMSKKGMKKPGDFT